MATQERSILATVGVFMLFIVLQLVFPAGKFNLIDICILDICILAGVLTGGGGGGVKPWLIQYKWFINIREISS